MKYRSCFVGIPLPEEFQSPFAETAEEVRKLIGGINIVDKKTPHVTVHYLGEQSRKNLEKAKKVAEKHKGLLTGSFLNIERARVFSPQRPNVLALSVSRLEPFFEYKKEVSEELRPYNPDDRDRFIPHLTIGRIPKNHRKEYARQEEKIKSLLEKTNWEFEIKKIALYGIDPESEPKKQKIVFDIDV